MAGKKKNASAKASVAKNPKADPSAVAATDAEVAAVVELTAEARAAKGFREVEVVATRAGHYGLKLRGAGEVFVMGLVGDGYLPSWVKPANAADKDPLAARSRQAPYTSSGQEIVDDVRRDAGTDVPTYLGGNAAVQRDAVL